MRSSRSSREPGGGAGRPRGGLERRGWGGRRRSPARSGAWGGRGRGDSPPYCLGDARFARIGRRAVCSGAPLAGPSSLSPHVRPGGVGRRCGGIGAVVGSSRSSREPGGVGGGRVAACRVDPARVRRGLRGGRRASGATSARSEGTSRPRAGRRRRRISELQVSSVRSEGIGGGRPSKVRGVALWERPARAGERRPPLGGGAGAAGRWGAAAVASAARGYDLRKRGVESICDGSSDPSETRLARVAARRGARGSICAREDGEHLRWFLRIRPRRVLRGSRRGCEMDLVRGAQGGSLAASAAGLVLLGLGAVDGRLDRLLAQGRARHGQAAGGRGDGRRARRCGAHCARPRGARARRRCLGRRSGGRRRRACGARARRGRRRSCTRPARPPCVRKGPAAPWAGRRRRRVNELRFPSVRSEGIFGGRPSRVRVSRCGSGWIGPSSGRPSFGRWRGARIRWGAGGGANLRKRERRASAEGSASSSEARLARCAARARDGSREGCVGGPSREV